MRIHVPKARLSIEPDDTWEADDIAPGSEHLGLYLRSTAHGVYLNVRGQEIGEHELSKEGLIALLREQSWGPSIDEWSSTSKDLTIVGGSFEATGMGGEIVMEIFVTDGHRVANLAGPGPRQVMEALRPAAARVAATIRFE
ncbi:MAG TPA: hypothetical protein VF395_08900 [Polyangiaceae bacterium]